MTQDTRDNFNCTYGKTEPRFRFIWIIKLRLQTFNFYTTEQVFGIFVLTYRVSLREPQMVIYLYGETSLPKNPLW